MMRGAVAPACLAPLFLATFAQAADPPDGGAAVFRFGASRETVTVAPGQRRICFDHAPMWIGSLVLRAPDRSYVPGVDYTVDENDGCVELTVLPADSLTFFADYRYVPVSSPLRMRLHAREALSPSGPETLSVLTDAEEDDGTRLRVGGSKTFVVEVGSNRDATLRQSLDLRVRGNLSRDVELSAVLSDRDSPVTPEGTSAELDELDKVLIQVRSRTAEATFGDIEVRQEQGLFARYERQLEGVEVKRFGDVSGGALAANARGSYVTVEFFGQEGKQGPYDLGTLAGRGRIPIVPGSEEVTLDGERLERGQTRDYTIDYGLGELTFTPVRPVTFDSRVTVDFEEETEAYRRQFFGANAGARVDERFSVNAYFLSESDDRGAPRGFSLSEEEKNILAGVGDEDPVGDTFASQFVGAGNGDYVEVQADSLAPAHFEWVGPGNGDTLVNFIRVGDNLGAYADSVLADDTVIYRFVGTGLGDFEPGRSLARPESHTVGDMQLRYETERVSVASEVAVSQRDRNTFSDFDDGDNDGWAGHGTVRLTSPTWAEGRGEVRLEGEWREIDSDFAAFSRVRESFDFVDWNYSAGQLGQGEKRSRASLGVSPGVGGDVQLDVARLSSGNVFAADRVGAGYRLAGPVTANARWDRTWSEEPVTDTSGRRDAARADVTVAAMPVVTPTVTYRYESSEATGDTLATGRRFRSVGVAGRTDVLRPVSLRVDYTQRLDDRRSEERTWGRSAKTRDRGAQIGLSPVNGMQGLLEFRRRTFESRSETPSQTTNLARLNWSAEPRRRPIRLQLDYQVTTESEAKRAKNIAFVGDGRGNYDSLGVFVGTGDYDVTIEDSGETELLSRLDVVLRGSLLGASDPALGAVWRNVQANSFLRIRRSSRDPFEELVNPFRGAFFSTGTGTVDGALTLRQEVTLFPNERVSPRVRWERLRQVDGRFDNVRDLREEDVVALLVRATPRPRWTVSVEGLVEETSDIVERLVPTPARDADTFTKREIGGEVSHKPTPPWTLALSGTVAETTTPGSADTEESITVAPRVAWNPGRLGRIELRVSWVDVSGALVRRRPVFAFGLENQSGVEWSTLADFRLKDYLTLVGTLRSVRPRGASTLYDGRMELRAFF